MLPSEACLALSDSPAPTCSTIGSTGKSNAEMETIDLRNSYRRLKDPSEAEEGWNVTYNLTEKVGVLG